MIRTFECLDSRESSVRTGLRQFAWRRDVTLATLCTLLVAGPTWGADAAPATFINLSLEELGDLRVTSVSKKEQRLVDAAAAIYVITEEAIRRSGARTLPEALRLAPNLQVAQATANTYAITARGFNSTSANKLLVLIDGRAIYTPLYSGVFWDAQDVVLEDVDRIEVISGPGGTLWGANAVNGVINVITKRANASTGDLVRAMGDNAGYRAIVRHGATSHEGSAAYRLYAKIDQGKNTSRVNGTDTQDGWDRAQVGFRTDGSDWTVQGDAYSGTTDQVAPGHQVSAGANLVARWVKTAADGASLRIQTYFDRTMRDVPGTFSETLNTLDLDVQYSLPDAGGKQTIWGGGYRVSDDQVGNTAALAFLPAQRMLRWANLFVQQERPLAPGVQLIAGGKLETNDYTGLEFLPSLKLAWKPQDDELLWVGLARAIRAPSRLDTEFFVPAPYNFAGGPDFKSEIANTLELGWRAQTGQSLSYSTVVFHSEYERLRSVDPLPNGLIVFGNQIRGQINGVEAWASYQASQTLSFDASVVVLDERFSGPNLASSSPGNDPRLQWTLGSKWNISGSQQLDIKLRHVGELPSPVIPAYTAMDVRYAWQVSKGTDLAVIGRNLFNPRHSEFASGSGALAKNPVQLESALRVALTVRF